MLSYVSGILSLVNGPFRCGEYPDLNIFKSKLLSFLQGGESIFFDNGYIHVLFIMPNTVPTEKHSEHAKIRTSHETVNEQIKNFNAVPHILRHHRSANCFVFHVVARLKEMIISSGDNQYSI